MRAPRSMLVLTIIAAAATHLSAHGQSTMGLDGRWTVDLSTDPTKPYEKQMELKLDSDGSVSGSIYDSRILAGRWKNDRQFRNNGRCGSISYKRLPPLWQRGGSNMGQTSFISVQLERQTDQVKHQIAGSSSDGPVQFVLASHNGLLSPFSA